MMRGSKKLAFLLAAAVMIPTLPAKAAQPEEIAEVKAEKEEAAVPETTKAVNPYLPLWEHIPDGEPRVFEDPDNPGKYRVYIYGSHDNQKNSTYCGYDHVVWSAPVENLGNWRYEGVSYDCDGLLYAPDVVEKDGKYYLYTYDLSHGNSVAVSDRPAGPFQNMGPNGGHKGSGIGADPAILVDDDGKMYAYWGYQTYYQAEIDPETMAVKPGTTTKDAISNCNQEGEFQFYEGTSIRKVDGKYVMVYCQKPDKDPENGVIHDNYRARLAYAYSDNPLGPWTYGGPIIDNGGELLTNGKMSYPDGNVHGGIIEANDQWYVFYHRMTNKTEFSRQAMMEPLEVSVDPAPGGKVDIKQSEMTSQGADSDGLDAYQHYDAGIACYLTEGAYITTDYSQTSGYNPVAGLKDGCVVGYKYMDFGNGVGEDEFLKLALDMKTKGTDGRLDIFIDDPNNGTRKTDGTGTKIGSINISGNSAKDFRVEETMVENVTGKHALFFVFTSDSKDGEICEINGFEFKKETAIFQDDLKDDLEKWNVAGNPSANAAGTTLNSGDVISTKDGAVWENYKTELTASGNVSVIFRRSDEKNYYQAEVKGDQVVLSVVKNDKKIILKTSKLSKEVNGEYKLTVSNAEDQIIVKINGEVVLNTRDDSWRKGGVALAGTEGAVVHDVLVTEAVEESAVRSDSIFVDGKALEGFNVETKRYSVEVDKDVDIPVVTASTTDENVKVSVDQADQVPGAAVVKFVNGEEIDTYVIDFYRKDVVNYDFTQGKLPEGWSIYQPKDADKNITYSEKGVTISTDAADLPGTANQLQLDQPLKGNYQIDTHMTIDQPLHQNWAKYGMTIYQNDQNMVIMDHEHDRSGAKVQILWWKDSEWMQNGVSAAYGGSEMYFRLKKEGNNFTCLYSADGQEYKAVYTAETDGRFEENSLLHLFFSKQNANNDSFKGTVEYVTVSSLGEKTEVDTGENELETLAVNIGSSMTVPAGDYKDAEAIAEKAQEILNHREDVKNAGVSAKVEVKEDGFVLTLTKDNKNCVTAPFRILVEKTREELQALVEEAKKLDKNEYASSAWDRMEYAVEKAEEVLAEESASSYAVSEAYDRLKSALDGMEKIVSKTYRLTVEGGSGSGEYKEGEEVQIAADKPAEGLVFDQWLVEKDVKIEDASKEKTTITMPAHHTVVKASYKRVTDQPGTPDDGKPNGNKPGNGGADKAGTVKTGDTAAVGSWVTLLTAAIAVVIASVCTRKRRNN